MANLNKFPNRKENMRGKPVSAGSQNDVKEETNNSKLTASKLKKKRSTLDNTVSAPNKTDLKNSKNRSFSLKTFWASLLLSKRIHLFVSGTAFILALGAIGLSLIIYEQTAYFFEDTLVGDATKQANVNNVDFEILNKQIDDLTRSVAENTDKYKLIQKKLATDFAESEKLRRSSNSLVAKNVLDDLTEKLTALEKSLDNQKLSELEKANDITSLVETQFGLMVASGLLVENLAGRSLDKWMPALDALNWQNVDLADKEIIQASLTKSIGSRSELLTLGRLQLEPMKKIVNTLEADGQGLMDQARARLRDLIQLQRIDDTSDQKKILLNSFQTALNQADFDSAFTAANIWSSAGLGGLDDWLVSAKLRYDLDEAVNRLAAVYVHQAIGQN